MARMGSIANRAEALLGAAVVATTPVAGGDICTSARLRLSDGRSALVKTRAHAPATFFGSEAAGLRWLGEAGEAGGVHVPAVLAVEEDCLIVSWIDPGRPSAEAAERFGRALAATHLSGAGQFGGDADGFIGSLPLPNRPADSWPEFFATRRILPYLKLARDRIAISADDAEAIESVVRKITDLAGPDEPPARIHGDLWSGNLIWGTDGHAWVVDPAAHGGHRESDLAMLALFGAPQLARITDAYLEASPLASGWQERVSLHQLHPLLVHAGMFGGGYGGRAGVAARSLL